MTAGPQIACLLKRFEHSMAVKSTDCMEHHEQSPVLKKAFKRNVQALVVSFEETGNPFKDDGGRLLSLDSKVVTELTAVMAAASTYAAAMMQLAQSSPMGCSNITTLLRKGLKRELNRSKTLCEITSCMCLCNNGRLRNFP